MYRANHQHVNVITFIAVPLALSGVYFSRARLTAFHNRQLRHITCIREMEQRISVSKRSELNYNEFQYNFACNINKQLQTFDNYCCRSIERQKSRRRATNRLRITQTVAPPRE